VLVIVGGYARLRRWLILWKGFLIELTLVGWYVIVVFIKRWFGVRRQRLLLLHEGNLDYMAITAGS